VREGAGEYEYAVKGEGQQKQVEVPVVALSCKINRRQTEYVAADLNFRQLRISDSLRI
jgi:hypothetical protein